MAEVLGELLFWAVLCYCLHCLYPLLVIVDQYDYETVNYQSDINPRNPSLRVHTKISVKSVFTVTFRNVFIFDVRV